MRQQAIPIQPESTGVAAPGQDDGGAAWRGRGLQEASLGAIIVPSKNPSISVVYFYTCLLLLSTLLFFFVFFLPVLFGFSFWQSSSMLSK